MTLDQIDDQAAARLNAFAATQLSLQLAEALRIIERLHRSLERNVKHRSTPVNPSDADALIAARAFLAGRRDERYDAGQRRGRTQWHP